MVARRSFLQGGTGLVALALGLRSPGAHGAGPGSPLAAAAAPPWGPLLPDPQGVMDLPAGFTYRLFSRTGEIMNDGFLVPGMCDGMGAFPGPNGTIRLVRNHEVIPGDKRPTAYGPDGAAFARLPGGRAYDEGIASFRPCGGTTTLTLDAHGRILLDHHLSLAGTFTNCAGGKTPWNTWISCEELFLKTIPGKNKKHGYCFEVDPAHPNLCHAVPLTALGCFRHEAVAFDPNTGYAYLTEDQDDGLLYRFIPEPAGQLLRGRLQALALVDQPAADTSNGQNNRVLVGQDLPVVWIDLPESDPASDELRQVGHALGAAKFSRGEGINWGMGALWLACTSGGLSKQGQIWRLSGDVLRLVCQPDDEAIMSMPDNLCLSPFQTVMVAEDGHSPHKRILSISPQGVVTPLAEYRGGSCELAGCCWSPDGTLFFFNIFNPGATVVVSGPWPHLT